MKELPAQLEEAVKSGMNAAIEGDPHGMADAVAQALAHHHAGLFAACAAWAHAVKIFGGVPDLGVGENFASMRVIDCAAGGAVEPESLPDAVAPVLWAARFITAHLNGDIETQFALYNAVPDNQLEESALRVLQIAGATARQG